MCVTNGLSAQNNTYLYIGEVVISSTLYHTLGYGNTTKNLAEEPNAMILTFPTKTPMTKANVLNTDGCPNILRDMKNAIEPPVSGGRGGDSKALLSFEVEVFDSGIYTVVLAQDPRMISSALNLVSKEKRPPLNPELFEFYARAFPGQPVALCCFNNRDAVEADPMFWYYEPEDHTTFILPGVDCHTGESPDPNALVGRDHWLMYGSYRFEEGVGDTVLYTDQIPESTRVFLPDKVVGMKIEVNSLNGDFASNKESILANQADLRYLPFAA
jgi:hypothetical protein